MLLWRCLEGDCDVPLLLCRHIQSFVVFQGDDAWTNLCAAQARLEDNKVMKDSVRCFHGAGFQAVPCNLR